MTRVSLILLCFTCAETSGWAQPARPAESDEWVAYFPPQFFRVGALTAPLPQYPPEAIQRRQEGRVVVGVQVAGNGEVQKVDVLESSTAEMATSVVASVAKWSFKPGVQVAADLKGKVRTGRLVFYFRRVRGTFTVIDAVQVSIDATRAAYSARHSSAQ